MAVKDVMRSDAVQRAAGVAAAEFLRFVWLTNRFSYDPPDLYPRLEAQMPAIVAFWHGQHFMMPFLKQKHHRAKVLVSRHRDGAINAIASERLEVGTVRGSGDHGSSFHRKGGAPAFKGMLRVLNEGINMAVTADVPKVARRAGLGIIMLARESGRPIVPIAIATSRYKRFNNWDRSTISLPFGRGVIASAEPIDVPTDVDAGAMETLRAELEARLNALTLRAYTIVGRPEGAPHG